MTSFKRKRKTTKKADAILTADWHIRPDVPVCRTDDFLSAMKKKIDFIIDLSKKNECPILIAGDIGHKPSSHGWPPWLMEWAVSALSGGIIIAIAGQHDLPNHKLDLWKESGIGVLQAAGAIELVGTTVPTPIFKFRLKDFNIFGFPYGVEIQPPDNQDPIKQICLTHQMVIESKPLWPGQEAPKGNALLKKHPYYDLIVSGDNHGPFVAEYEGRILVNPGSLMRSNADQIDHKPRVYLWYSDSNTVEPVYLPIEQGVIDRTHIENAKGRESRNKMFIERVNKIDGLEIKYERNLEKYFDANRTEKAVKEKVWAHVE